MDTTSTGVVTASRSRIPRRFSFVAAGAIAVAVLTGTGIAPDAAASPATSGTIPVSSRSSGAPAAPLLTQAASRPANGAVLTRRGSGSGSFTVDNTRGPGDAVVTLSNGSRAVLVVYVRGGQKATTTKVPDGTFTVFVERGENWNATTRHFDRPGSAGRFDRQAAFTSSRTSKGTRYTTITLTLHGVVNGNTSLLPIAPGSVPA